MSDYEEGFIARLRPFGLNEKEARVYFCLLKHGARNVAQLTESTNGHRVGVYRILESLTHKGFVETSFSKPRIFAAVPLNIALNFIIQRDRNELQQKESAEAEFLEYANPARLALETTDGTGQFRLIYGGNDILATASQMIARAQHTTLAIIRPHTMTTLSHFGVLDAYRNAAERGVEVLIVTDVIPNNFSAVRELMNTASIGCYRAYMGILFFTADEGESMTIITANHQRPMNTTDSAFWIKNVDYTAYLASTFEMIWQQSIELKTRIKQIHKMVLSMDAPVPHASSTTMRD